MDIEIRKMYEERIGKIRFRLKEIIQEQEQLNDAAGGKRSLTPQENKRWDRLNEEFQNRQEELRKLQESGHPSTGGGEYDNTTGRLVPDDDDNNDTRSIAMQRDRIANIETRETFGKQLKGEVELRTLQKDSDTKGGFTVIQQDINKEIWHDQDNQVHIRRLATIFRVDRSDEFGIPIMDSDVSDPDFKGEISEAELDTSMSFEKRVLHPKRLVKGIKVSRDLLKLSATNFGDFVQSRLSYKLAVTAENSFLNGSGVNEPLGLFTTSVLGVSASRNVSAGNTATAISGDGLINAMYALKGQYLQNRSCRWIFHRDALKMIRKLKDGDGQYLWMPGIGQDRPSTILGVEYLLSEYAPNTFTTGLRVGCIADLSFYGIAEMADLEIQVLIEKYALENSVAYLIQQHIDGMPMLEQAFSMVTLA